MATLLKFSTISSSLMQIRTVFHTQVRMRRRTVFIKKSGKESYFPNVRTEHWKGPPDMTKKSNPPLDQLPTLEEFLETEKLKQTDPSIHFKVDISLPQVKPSPKAMKREIRSRVQYLKSRKMDPAIERLARHGKLEVNLEDVEKDWRQTDAALQLKNAADYYGIFSSLYSDAYFYPIVPVKVIYDSGCPVYRGNLVKPGEATSAPVVTYEAEASTLWTLVMTNLDGHFTEEAEYLHWFIGNIPGNDVSKGDLICHYLQPFAPKGTGFHRFAFVLYKQEKKIDFSKWSRPNPCYQLSDRTFRTREFYQELQDVITPGGLCFFQSDWDTSLKDFFHQKLEMPEPIYEYEFPPVEHLPQKYFPVQKAFNLYLDRYRDPKDIANELLIKRLQKAHPFKEPEPPFPYPNAFPIDLKLPSWLRTEIKKERLGRGKYRYMYDD